MHLVFIAWLYVIGLVALTASSFWAGLGFFLAAGAGPVGLWLWIRGRRLRGRHE